MMTLQGRLLLVVGLLLAGSCSKPEPEPAPVVLEQAGDPADRALALFPVVGDGPTEIALGELQAALLRQPKKHDYWVLLGEAWVKKARQSFDPGFYVHADAAAKVALAIEPDSRVARQLRGLVMLNNHDFAGARDLATVLTREQPADPRAWGVLSDALLELGDVDGASAAADQMMERKPNLPSYARASYLSWLRGDVKQALEAIRLAIDAGGGQRDREPSAWVLTDAANIFWHRGDVDGAIAGCDRALRELPGYPPALALKARALLEQGKAADARPLAERSLAQAPLTDTARLVAAIATALHDDAAAAAALVRARAIGESTDHLGLALLLADQGEQLERALLLVDEEKKKRGGVYVDDVRSWVLFKLGRLDEARVDSDRALRWKTPDRRLLEHAAAIRTAQKDPTAAALQAEAKLLR